QHRAGGGAEIDTQFAGDNLGQGGFAKAGRAGKQHMVQRLAAALGGVDKDFEIFPRLGLADKIGQRFGTQRSFQRVVFAAFGRDESFDFTHLAMPRSASRSNTPVSAPSPRSLATRATASAAWPSE